MENRSAYEVAVIYAGALERTEFFDDESEAVRFAEREARDCQLASEGRGSADDYGEEWQVYLTPHYCVGDDECVCAQYLTDHRPLLSSEGSAQ